jgi:dipeptidyl aminopeptidase/acylaminoacyl peptidase
MMRSERRGRLILTIYLLIVALLLAVDRLAAPATQQVKGELIFISDTDSIDARRESNSIYRIDLDGRGGGLGSRGHRPADTHPSMKRIVGSIPQGDGYLRTTDIDCHAASQALVIASQRQDLNGFHHALLDGSGLHLDKPATGDSLSATRQIAIAPDGVSIIVSRQFSEVSATSYGLVAGDLRSRRYSSIRPPTAGVSYRSPVWSPAGGSIAYIIERQISDGTMTYQLATARASGADEAIVYETSLRLGDVAWSPDGEWFALEMSRQIYKLRPDGSDLTQLSRHQAGASSPRWSPDGERISFVAPSSYSGFNQLIVMDADGRNIRQIANIRGEVVNGCWV